MMTGETEQLGASAFTDGSGLPRELVVMVASGASRGHAERLVRRLRVGKATDNDLVLNDDTVSRHHCELEIVDGGIRVRDLGSTNHTRADGTIVKEALVQPGASLRIGAVELLLRAELDRSRLPPSERRTFGEAIGESSPMRAIFGLLERIAHTEASVLLEGETGTGKDVLAKSIHQESQRAREPFVVVDCGAVSYQLIESELFGHERGAFTGAVAARQGAFELAGRGTVFLDEVGELPIDVQPKLLRVLESGEFRRVGANKVQRSEARVVAATKRNLAEEVARGKFREDLYFRLAVVPVQVPSLRSRREDIPLLVAHFLEAAKKRNPDAPTRSVDPSTIRSLAAHDWPGNVRELRNVIDRALYLADGPGPLSIFELPGAAAAEPSFQFDPSQSYRETRAEFEATFERAYVRFLLGRHAANVSAAAREARMDRKHLYDLARKHGLRDSRGD